MPRRAFIADLQAASSSQLPLGFTDLKQGDEDGSFTVAYKHAASDSLPIVLQITVGVDEYPHGHSNLVFVITDAAPSFVETAISDATQFEGLKVLSLVSRLGRLFDAATAGSQPSCPVNLDSDTDEEDADDELMDVEGLSDEDDFDNDGFDDPFTFGNTASSSTSTAKINFSNKADRDRHDERVRSDLRLLKQAGFHVSCQGDPFGGGKDFYLTISCRINKLNISDDALNAWGFSPEKYFLLMIHYNNGYRPLHDFLGDCSSSSNSSSGGGGGGRANVSFRTGICSKRKISRQEIIDCFSTVGTTKNDVQNNTTSATEKGPSISAPTNALMGASAAGSQLEKYFIDAPMNELLNGRLPEILRAREKWGFSWNGAEQFCQDYQAMTVISDEIDPKYWNPEPVQWRTAPMLNIGDHFVTATSPSSASFPLIVAEFTLRHLIHCTEFCLVCHTHLDVNFEALKPYVCSKGLCLYQYMALGFGPSIEHEIINQPYVVDLLISLCYLRALSRSLQDTPIGMGLQVPSVAFLTGEQATPSRKSKATAQQGQEGEVGAKSDRSGWNGFFDSAKHQLVLKEDSIPELQVGDWVAIRLIDQNDPIIFESKSLFRKIEHISLPTITFQQVAQPIDRNVDVKKPSKSKTAATSAAASKNPPVRLYHAVLHRIDDRFDDESAETRVAYIAALLDQLPPVRDMKQALLDNNRRRTLAQVLPSVLPAALNVLRWVVASNRSCIVAIDDLDTAEASKENRVHGMPGYMQFRFAQGNPDKEHRFINAVDTTQGRTKKAQPTLWAWHGSSVSNWHSIIREGLHYKDVVNGRAYGHGVYFARDPSVSVNYASNRSRAPLRLPVPDSLNLDPNWRGTALELTSVLSLNEIVNDPASFQSTNPYFVVQHLDWIQPRYLFVKLGIAQEKQTVLSEAPNVKMDAIPQDREYLATGSYGRELSIPMSAISAARHMKSTAKSGFGFNLLKKMKIGGGGDKAAKEAEDVLMSDVTDDEDLALVGQGSKFRTVIDLTADSPPPPSGPTSPAKRNSIGEVKAGDELPKKKKKRVTDFVPGSLDVTTLPRLPNPPYATPQASKALARELKDLQKTQANGDPAELGWYLCEEALDNIYQWIVELHSFDPSEALAKDMKAKGVTSIVLELRFGPQFPYSPPFVRVISPRFLDFSLGGGGHVTAGGAMCMELLTNDGWSVATSIEAVLLQIRLALLSQPRPARLVPSSDVGGYRAGEAIEAYRRVCAAHGWTVPADFSLIAAQQPETQSAQMLIAGFMSPKGLSRS